MYDYIIEETISPPPLESTISSSSESLASSVSTTVVQTTPSVNAYLLSTTTAASTTASLRDLENAKWSTKATNLLAVVLVGTWTFLWLTHIVAYFYGRWKLHRRRKTKKIPSSSADNSAKSPPDATTLESGNGHPAESGEKSSENPAEKPRNPGVSIIKPLCSNDDPNIVTNLQTFFTLKYPKYEILFCIQNSEDESLKETVRNLSKKYPHVDTQIFVGGHKVGVNPKINNMNPAYKAAKYELLLVSDAGIRMEEDTLTDMVSSMREDVGLVHQMPFIMDRPGIPGTLEKVYFGTSHARMYLCANFLGINCATGMSALMRKSVLDEAGGFKAFGSYLAEDFFFAKAMLSKGMKLDICSQPAIQNPGDSSVQVFQARISRWIKLRSAMCPHLILLEPVSECLVLGLAASWAFRYLFGWNPALFFGLHVLFWLVMDWNLIHIVQNGSLPFNRIQFLKMWCYREVTAPYTFMKAQLNPRIRWRRREFRLRWGGTAESCEIPADEENPLSGIEEGNPENVNNNEIEKKSLQLLLSQPPSDLVIHKSEDEDCTRISTSNHIYDLNFHHPSSKKGNPHQYFEQRNFSASETNLLVAQQSNNNNIRNPYPNKKNSSLKTHFRASSLNSKDMALCCSTNNNHPNQKQHQHQDHHHRKNDSSSSLNSLTSHQEKTTSSPLNKSSRSYTRGSPNSSQSSTRSSSPLQLSSSSINNKYTQNNNSSPNSNLSAYSKAWITSDPKSIQHWRSKRSPLEVKEDDLVPLLLGQVDENAKKKVSPSSSFVKVNQRSDNWSLYVDVEKQHRPFSSSSAARIASSHVISMN